MPTLDEELSRRMKTAARPVAEVRFDDLLRRKARRELRGRVQSGALALLILAAVAGAFYALGRSKGGVPAATPTLPPGVRNGSIVFVATDRYGHSHIRSLSAAGDAVTLTSGPFDLQPDVSPSGDSVVFSRQQPTKSVNPGTESGLYVVPASAGGLGGGEPSRLLDHSWFASDPAFSPDGSKIAFAGGGPSRASGIYVMSADGRGTPSLVYGGKTDLAIEGHPSWSPDGKKIVFQEANGGLSTPPNFDLYVVNSDGTGIATDITKDGSASQVEPDWSPDGSRIAFSAQTVLGLGDIRAAIATISPDGSGLRLITTGELFHTDPTWAPDGKFIAYAVGDKFPAISEISTDGAGPPTEVAVGADPAWAPLRGADLVQAPPDSSRITGVEGLVCNLRSITGYFAPENAHSNAYLFTRPGGGSCPAVTRTRWYLALDRHGLGPFSDTVVSSPIHCFAGCRFFGVPDLDGDRIDELAIVVSGGLAAGGSYGDRVVLYRVDPNGLGPVFTRIDALYPGSSAVGDFSFEWGDHVPGHLAGAMCRSGGFDVWTANEKSGTWDVRQTWGDLNGSTILFGPVSTSSSDSQVARLLSRLGAFCGSPVTP